MWLFPLTGAALSRPRPAPPSPHSGGHGAGAGAVVRVPRAGQRQTRTDSGGSGKVSRQGGSRRDAPPREHPTGAPGAPTFPHREGGGGGVRGGRGGKDEPGPARPNPHHTSPPPKGPTAPDPGRTGGPRGVFKPPRRDALGTWKGGRESERTGRGTGGGERDPRPLTATNLRRHHPPDADGPGPRGAQTARHRPTPPRGGGPRSRLRAFQPPPQHTHTPPRTPPTAPRPACPTPARPRPLATQGEGRRREAGCRAWRGDGAARWGRRGKVGGGEGKEDTRDGRGRGDPEAAAAGRGDPGQQTPGWGGTGGAAGARGSGARGRPSPPPSPADPLRPLPLRETLANGGAAAHRRGRPARAAHTKRGRRAQRERPRAPTPSVNDPSAGSPTETLLRLLLPLDSQVRPSSQRSARAVGRPRRGRSEGLTKPSNR